jgi:hypothetical protein
MNANKIIVHLYQIKQLECNHAHAGSMVFGMVTAVNRSGNCGHGLSKTLQSIFRCRLGRIILASSTTRLLRRSRKELAQFRRSGILDRKTGFVILDIPPAEFRR